MYFAKTMKQGLIGATLMAAVSVGSVAQAEDQLNVFAPTHDKQVMSLFSEKAGDLYKAEETVTVEALREQLSREKATVELKSPDRSWFWNSKDSGELYNEFKKSTLAVGVIYNCGNCDRDHVNAASGFVIHEDGVGVTNHHVIESMTSDKQDHRAMVVMDSEGNVYPITEVLASSKKDDLAIFRFDTKGKKVPAYALAKDVKVGSNAHVISNPGQRFFFYSKGVVSRSYIQSGRPDSKDAGAERMSITADYAAGSSGGPVFDDEGNIIGVVSSTNSVYYDQKEQKNLQMVIKQTIPVSRIKALIES